MLLVPVGNLFVHDFPQFGNGANSSVPERPSRKAGEARLSAKAASQNKHGIIFLTQGQRHVSLSPGDAACPLAGPAVLLRSRLPCPGERTGSVFLFHLLLSIAT